MTSCFFLFWTDELFFCVFVFCVCDAFVHKGILLYESLWWWLCKFHVCMYVCTYVSSLLAVIAQFPTSQLAFAPLSSSSSSPLWLYVCSPHPLLQILYISWCPFVLSLDCLPYPLVPTRLSYFKGFFDLICCKKTTTKKNLLSSQTRASLTRAYLIINSFVLKDCRHCSSSQHSLLAICLLFLR